jgi:hypothetical protein
MLDAMVGKQDMPCKPGIPCKQDIPCSKTWPARLGIVAAKANSVFAGARFEA